MTKTEIIDSLLEQARDKLSFVDGDEDDVFMNDALVLTEAAQRLLTMERHGEWEDVTEFGCAGINTDGIFSPIIRAHCSECGDVSIWTIGAVAFKFCPNCGAIMDGGNDG